MLALDFPFQIFQYLLIAQLCFVGVPVQWNHYAIFYKFYLSNYVESPMPYGYKLDLPYEVVLIRWQSYLTFEYLFRIFIKNSFQNQFLVSLVNVFEYLLEYVDNRLYIRSAF